MTHQERLPITVSGVPRVPAYQSLLERQVLYSPKTHEWYQHTFSDFYRFAGDVEPLQITRHLVLAWVKDLKERIKTRSVNNRFRGLRAYCNWLVTEGFQEVSSLEGIRAHKLLKMLVTVFTEEHVTAMIELCPPSRWWGARDGAIIHLLLTTGIRLAGLIGLKEQDINPSDRLLRVRGKGDKQGSIWLDPITLK